MVKLVVLEGWIKRVLRGCGPVGVLESYEVIGNKREPDPESYEGRTIVVILGGPIGEKLNPWFCGMVFDDVGCLLKYEACNVRKYVSEEVMREAGQKFLEDKKEGVKFTVKNVIEELWKRELMVWWFKKVL